MIALLFTVAVASEHPPEQHVERQAMALLGGWSATNIVAGTPAALTSSDPGWRAFHATNAAWNTVNLGLAVAGTVSMSRRPAESLQEREARGARLHRVLAINAGLDVAYMATGAGLWLAGHTGDQPSLEGMGSALLFQGAFLLAFDLGYRSRHRAALATAQASTR